MSINKYQWLTLTLASLMVSGCASGGKPLQGLGIADALRKTKTSLHNKKLSYQSQAPSQFGFATPTNHLPAAPAPPPLSWDNGAVALDSHGNVINDINDTTFPAQASIPCSNCEVNQGPTVVHDEFYLPPRTKVVTPTTSGQVSELAPIDSTNFQLVSPSDSQPMVADALIESNPLPGFDVQPSPSDNLDVSSDEEEAAIDTLDSTANQQTQEQDFSNATPSKDETSILETAAKALEGRTPTSTGPSVIDHNTSMLVLTARPVESHTVFDRSPHTAAMSKVADNKQVIHKRHYRQLNALRHNRPGLKMDVYEHTAELPQTSRFKPLPTLEQSSPTSKTNTGAPALKTKPKLQSLKTDSVKVQSPPLPTIIPEPKKRLAQRIDRQPILTANSATGATINALKSFTNVPMDDQARSTEAIIRTIKAYTAETTEPPLDDPMLR